MNSNERTDQIIKAIKEMPIQNNADNIKFRKLFYQVIVYSRDKLLFVTGNYNLKAIPKRPPFLFKGEHSYKIRYTEKTWTHNYYQKKMTYMSFEPH